MKKTSVYVSDDEDRRLTLLAERPEKSRALLLREALADYGTAHPDRNFEAYGSFVGPGDSIEDIAEDELLRGFGEQ